MIKTRGWLAILMTLAVMGCRERAAPSIPVPPKLELTAAAEARKFLPASTRIADPEGTLDKVGVAARKLGLAFDTDDVRRTLIQRSGWPYALIAQLDLRQPVGLAVTSIPVAGGPRRTTVVAAVALKNRSPAGQAAFVDAAGKAIGKDRDAVQVEGSNSNHDKLWLLPRDGAVLVADSREALVGGGALALAARTAGPTDVTVDLYPEAMARAAGTDLETALRKMKSDVATMQADAQARLGNDRGKPRAGAATDQLSREMVGLFADVVADSADAQIRLGVDPARGLTAVTAVRPKAGSALARNIARGSPYAVDPALLAGAPPAGLWALGDGAVTTKLLQLVRTALLEPLLGARDKDRVLRSYDTMAAAIAGPWSAAMRMAPGPRIDFAYDLVYRLKPGTDGGALLAAMAEMSRGSWLGSLAAASSGDLLSVKVASKRQGDVLTMVTTVSARDKEARAKLADIPFLNGKPIESSIQVAGDRLLVAVGGESKRRLETLRAGSPAATPPGAAAAALTETTGADGLTFIDLAAVLRPALSIAAAHSGDSPGMAGAVMGMALSVLGDMHLETYVSYQGGEMLTFTWRTPMGTFESAARLFRTLSGAAPGTTTRPL
jgi:hypothetical protein